MSLKWNGKGTLQGTKSRKYYYPGDTVDPEDVSRERMEELLDTKQLVGKMPEEVVEDNKKKAAAKKQKAKPGRKPKATPKATPAAEEPAADESTEAAEPGSEADESVAGPKE